MVRADQDDITETARYQLSSTEKKSTDEYFAQFCVGLNKPQKLIAVYLDHFAGFSDAKRYQSPATGEHRDLAGELSGLNGDHRRLAIASEVQGFDGSRVDDEKLWSGFSSRDEDFAALDAPNAAVRGDALDLLRRQSGKSLVDIWRGS
jgi:hypothetical protein